MRWVSTMDDHVQTPSLLVIHLFIHCERRQRRGVRDRERQSLSIIIIILQTNRTLNFRLGFSNATRAHCINQAIIKNEAVAFKNKQFCTVAWKSSSSFLRFVAENEMLCASPKYATNNILIYRLHKTHNSPTSTSSERRREWKYEVFLNFELTNVYVTHMKCLKSLFFSF
jgi:hypothetical protein